MLTVLSVEMTEAWRSSKHQTQAQCSPYSDKLADMLKACRFHDVLCVVQRPGDVIYMPPSMMHAVYTAYAPGTPPG